MAATTDFTVVNKHQEFRFSEDAGSKTFEKGSGGVTQKAVVCFLPCRIFHSVNTDEKSIGCESRMCHLCILQGLSYCWYFNG